MACRNCQRHLRLIARLRAAVAAEASGGGESGIMTDRQIMRALTDAGRMLNRKKISRRLAGKPMKAITAVLKATRPSAMRASND